MCCCACSGSSQVPSRRAAKFSFTAASKDLDSDSLEVCASWASCMAPSAASFPEAASAAVVSAEATLSSAAFTASSFAHRSFAAASQAARSVAMVPSAAFTFSASSARAALFVVHMSARTSAIMATTLSWLGWRSSFTTLRLPFATVTSSSRQSSGTCSAPWIATMTFWRLSSSGLRRAFFSTAFFSVAWAARLVPRGAIAER
mmetsp:Transcript_49659/g.146787  ORF Transcript_49659/g.146787 Transcript_49659/m.146787 type:complete len:203 (+) Transcript_49659:851-1459(+)